MKRMGKSADIQVTQSFLPKFSVYQRYLKQIWKNHHLTNNGPLVKKLEVQLRRYFHVKHCIYVSNGTIALQLAIRALNLHGEIITTPFTYVATANSIIWEHCTPIFVDIETDTLTIDVTKIEPAITKKTCAIMGVHVYGFPCDVTTITKIASKYKLKVIYDAAHAFGTIYRNKSLMSYGNVSTLSFHATKLFHTAEGGAIITNNDKLAKKIMLYRAFGHIYDEYFTFGINGKNSELHAAMGLSIFPSLPMILKRLKQISKLYDSYLEATSLKLLHCDDHTEINHSYYPIIFPKNSLLLRVMAKLKKNNIYPRRYFYPSLNTLPFLHPNDCPQSESIASRILCLPLYVKLSNSSATRIASIVRSCL
jgi:dTDP-4-amino-4,6-dideoxygalactose transaminase